MRYNLNDPEDVWKMNLMESRFDEEEEDEEEEDEDEEEETDCIKVPNPPKPVVKKSGHISIIGTPKSRNCNRRF